MNLHSQSDKIKHFKEKKNVRDNKTDWQLTRDEDDDDDDDVPKPRNKEQDLSHHINYSEISKKIDPTNKTILHTCTGEVKGQKTKFLIDPGSDACLITKKHAEQLDLELIESSNTLTLNTFSGELKTTSIKTTIPISLTLKIAAFVVKNNISLDRVHFNFKTTWPGLEKELYNEVKKNIAYGKLDSVIGTDQLY